MSGSGTTPPTVLAGVAIALLGASVAVLAWLQPQQMRAPPWVVYTCALAFVWAGATVVARARGMRRLQAWLPVPLLACMVAPAFWLAFGPGHRACTISLLQGMVRIFGGRSDLPCRIGFGIAALVGLGLVLMALRQAIRSSREPPL